MYTITQLAFMIDRSFVVYDASISQGGASRDDSLCQHLRTLAEICSRTNSCGGVANNWRMQTMELEKPLYGYSSRSMLPAYGNQR